jgi:two-component system NarL family sensor kinase
MAEGLGDVFEELRMRGDRGLDAALEDHVEQWSLRTGIAVETWALPGDRVTPRVADNVFRTVCEALDNVERHSNARTVSIAVTAGRRGLRLTVSDDGQGFVPGRTGGRGIVAMKAYFAELGGTLSVNPVPGAGTTVSGVIPAR